MLIKTTRFGALEIEPQDLLDFPAGLPGLEDCKRFVLLADAGNEALAWLQSVTRPEIALAVVSPRRFVPSYQLRVSSAELTPLSLTSVADAKVLAVLGKRDGALTVNLKAPLVLNLERRVGRQVVNNAETPVDFVLAPAALPLKRSA